MSLRPFLLALSTRPRIGAAMERLPVTRRFVRRFVAGPRPEDAIAALTDVTGRGLLGAVTYLGENVRTPAEAARAADMYVHLLDEIAQRRLPVVPSLKLTHLGLDLGRVDGESIVLTNLTRVLRRARAARSLVWIDMESAAYTDATLELYAALRPGWPEAACAVQAYLRRTARDVERLVDLGATVRLCKGAYREPPEVAFPDKRDVDANYTRLIDRLLAPDAAARGVYPGFATHDELMIAHAHARAREVNRPADRFEIQMLYGIRPDLHETLRAQGLRVRVLVPFGEDWYGYFMRRLAERPANLLFLFRSLRH